MKTRKAIEWLHKEIPSLIEKGVVSEEAAQRIKDYYAGITSKNKISLALAIFGVIGAVCVGLGIILLFAYNWDNISRGQKTVLAFAPLVISLVLLAWAVVKEKTSIAIREGFSVFNMISIGAAISLISQIYNIPGDIDTFLMTWMLLSIPVVYFMSSTLTAVLYLLGITVWAAMAQASGGYAVLFWFLTTLVFPHYFKVSSKDIYGSRSVWLASAVCLCFTVGIGISLEKVLPGLWIIIYSSFFSVLYLTGKMWFDDAPSFSQKPFRNYGIAGLTILSYIFTSKWVWLNIGWNYYRTTKTFHPLAAIADYVIAIVLIVVAVSLMVKAASKKMQFELLFGCMPILAVICYSLSGFGGNELIAVWIFNCYVLGLGVLCIIEGVRERLLGLMNAGILITGVIILTRFLDSSLGIFERGLVFIIIGICFIAANIFLSQSFKKEEE